MFRGGTGLVIELATLKAGEYTFTGFFHDNTVQQKTGRLTVDLDGWGTGPLGEVEVVSSFDFSTGTAPAAVGTASFTFEADGTNPVAILVRSADDGTAHILNGFTLEPVGDPEAPTLEITLNGEELDFSWNSIDGTLYDLVTSTDLLTPINTWPVYDDGVRTYDSIPATGATTTLSGVQMVGPGRFFSLRFN